MDYQQRTATCGELRPDDAGRTVILNGWVNARRDYGGIVFLDIRDRYGVTQVVVDTADTPELAAKIKDVRSEWVLWASGTVRMRENPNPRIPTGLIEIIADEVGVINRSEVPPFEIVDDLTTNEETRLEYRYLDLRRHSLQQNFLIRLDRLSGSRNSQVFGRLYIRLNVFHKCFFHEASPEAYDVSWVRDKVHVLRSFKSV